MIQLKRIYDAPSDDWTTRWRRGETITVRWLTVQETRRSEMALLPWRPSGELSALQWEMNRLFEQFFGELPSFDIASRGWTPRLEMAEMKDSLTIKAELPGLEAKDVDVALSGDTLTIKGEKKQDHEDKDETHHVMERTYGAFSRMVRLPAPVAAEKIKASFKNGVLTISLPKTEAAKQRAIPIHVG